jgi:ParB/RepB/Spo0J family partition protein
MPPKGKLHVGSNIGIDKEQAYKDKIADLLKNQVRDIPLLLIDEIENIRTGYDEEGIQQLAASIEKKGLLQPVILSEEGTRYSIQAGHRRVLAFRFLKRETIPSIIRPTPEFLAEVQLIENIQREELSPADLETAVRALVARHGSQEKVSQLLMKSKQWVSNVMAASRVRESIGPTLEKHNVKDSLPSGHLRDIAALPPSDRVQAAKEALADGGGKRAFRKAAQKAKNLRESAGSSGRTVRLWSFSLAVAKQPNGRLTFTPEVVGDPSPEAKARFDSFCEDVKSLLSTQAALAGNPRRSTSL